MTAVVVSVTLLVVACLTIAWCRYCEVSREVETVIRNRAREDARETERWEADKERRPLHPSEWGPGAYLLPPPDVPFDVLPPSAAIVPPPPDQKWCDCEVCAKARARLVALFNDTPEGNQ